MYCVGLGGPDEIADPRVSVGEPPASDIARLYSSEKLDSSFARWIISLVSLDDKGLVGKAVRRGAGAIVVCGCVSLGSENSDNAMAGNCGSGRLRRDGRR